MSLTLTDNSSFRMSDTIKTEQDANPFVVVCSTESDQVMQMVIATARGVFEQAVEVIRFSPENPELVQQPPHHIVLDLCHEDSGKSWVWLCENILRFNEFGTRVLILSEYRTVNATVELSGLEHYVIARQSDFLEKLQRHMGQVQRVA